MSESRLFVVDGHRLNGGLSRTEDPRAVLILCHGIPSGGDDDPLDRGYPGLADDFAQHGYETWWFDFRGARTSEGSFTFGGWIDDLHGVIATASKPNLPLVIVGSSAGGAVALCAASESTRIHAVATLAAPAFFTRNPNAQGETLLQHSRRVGLITEPLLDPRDEENWWAELETNRPEFAVTLMAGRPILIVQGTSDTVVEPRHAERLYENAVEPRELAMLEGGTHQLRRDPRAIQAVLDWLERSTG